LLKAIYCRQSFVTDIVVEDKQLPQIVEAANKCHSVISNFVIPKAKRTERSQGRNSQCACVADLVGREIQ